MIKSSAYSKYNKWLILLLVFSLYSGRFLKMPVSSIPIYISFIGIFICFVLLARNIVIIKLNIVIILMLCFLLSIFLSMYNNNLNGYSISKVVEFTLYVIPLVFISNYIFLKKQSIIMFFKIIFFVSLIFAISAFVISLINGNLLIGRLSVFGGGPITFSRFMSFGFIASLALLLLKDSKLQTIHRILIFLALSLFTVSIALSGSRQSFIGLIIFTFIFFLLSFIQSNQRKKIKKFSIFSSIIVFSIITINFIPEKILQNLTIYQRLTLLFKDDKGESVNIRVQMINLAFEKFKENPIFGWGVGSFKEHNTINFLYPHNIFAEIIFELGLVGLIIFLLNLIICTFLIFKYIRRSSYEQDETLITIIAGITTMFLFSVFTAQISGDLYDNRWIWFFSILLVKINSFREIR
ncbi:O-antigen ligase family protein [Rossellomorea sp. BNER]|uniref:O-antigen ligase family protein n=1 Tax=Rossellomorea sp. BNER TaxID=2962031 RepID=UPI003AF249A9|nr:O-antigen ligase family protein [Rossellomorea sp. BNER]